MKKNEIDLHGVKHENVGQLLDSFIWDCMKKKVSGIKIITGNSPEMRNIVSKIIDEYGFIELENFCSPASIVVNFE